MPATTKTAQANNASVTVRINALTRELKEISKDLKKTNKPRTKRERVAVRRNTVNGFITFLKLVPAFVGLAILNDGDAGITLRFFELPFVVGPLKRLGVPETMHAAASCIVAFWAAASLAMDGEFWGDATFASAVYYPILGVTWSVLAVSNRLTSLVMSIAKHRGVPLPPKAPAAKKAKPLDPLGDAKQDMVAINKASGKKEEEDDPVLSRAKRIAYRLARLSVTSVKLLVLASAYKSFRAAGNKRAAFESVYDEWMKQRRPPPRYSPPPSGSPPQQEPLPPPKGILGNLLDNDISTDRKIQQLKKDMGISGKNQVKGYHDFIQNNKDWSKKVKLALLKLHPDKNPSEDAKAAMVWLTTLKDFGNELVNQQKGGGAVATATKNMYASMIASVWKRMDKL